MQYLVFSILAQKITDYPLGEIGGPKEKGWGPWGQPGGPGVETAAGYFSKIISNVIGVMTIAGGIWFMFQIIIGGYNWMAAAGDQAKIKEAHQRLSNAFIGLVVLVAAYALIWIIGELLGFRILQPQALIKLIGPK